MIGSAYEDLQAQNGRLVQQMAERDEVRACSLSSFGFAGCGSSFAFPLLITAHEGPTTLQSYCILKLSCSAGSSVQGCACYGLSEGCWKRSEGRVF